MSSLRSSVRPKSSKQPWGTIIHPEFGLGYQKCTAYEVDQTVSRLYCIPDEKNPVYEKPRQKKMTKAEVEEMMNRLTNDSANRAVDANRTQANSIYHRMGVVNSFAWKGYN